MFNHHSYNKLYTTQGHLQAVQLSTVTSHYLRLSGICRLFNPPQSHHIIYDLGAFAGCSTTTVTSHYIRLKGICRLLNPPQSHHIIYDLGAFVGCSTLHSHITLYTTQGHMQAVQPPQSHHIIYELGAFVACSTLHSHITLYTTQGHLQAVQPTTVTPHYIPLRGIYRLSQPITVTSHYIRLRGICRLFNSPQSHHIIYDLGAHAGCSTTTVTSHYIRIRGICRLFNSPQSHHIIYDLVAFVASSTHHSHITLYMTQGHLQAVQPPQSHHIIYHLGAFTGCLNSSTVTSHYIRLRGICRLFNSPHSHHIIYDLGAFVGCSTTTVTSHYIRLRGICRLFNSPQSHHIIYDLVAFVGCSTHHSHITLYTTQGHLQAVQPTTVTSHYIRLRGICRLFNSPQSHHIIYDLGAFVGCSTHHSHITLYTNQGHLQAVQLSTVTSYYLRLSGICSQFNQPQPHHIIYDLGAFVGCSTHHSHITLYTTQGHLQAVQPTTVTSHYIRLRGICRLFNLHSHITLYTTQGHLQAVQPTTVTSHYIRLRGICRLFNPPQSHHIIYDLGAFVGCSTHHSHITLYTTQGHLQAVQLSTVTSHYIRLRGICRLFNPPQSHHIIYDLGAFVGCSTHHSHITLYTTQGHLQAVQPSTVTSHYIRLRGICRLFNPPQSHHIIYDLGAFVGCSTHHSHITLYTTQGH